jgi:hypothetical protein
MKISYEMMTPKERRFQVFLAVSNHLLEQRQKSFDGKFCRFRDDQGRSCAVGCLISDKNYDESLEGAFLDLDGDLTRALIASGVDIDVDMLQMLQCLQNIHDQRSSFLWREDLLRMSRDFKFTDENGKVSLR